MKDLIKQVSKKADDQLDFKKMVGGLGGTVLELLDGSVIRAGLEFAVEKIPSEYHDELEIIMSAYVSGDYSAIEEESIERLNDCIDLPFLDEEDEAIILEAIIGGFFKIVRKRQAQTNSTPDEPTDDDPPQ